MELSVITALLGTECKSKRGPSRGTLRVPGAAEQAAQRPGQASAVVPLSADLDSARAVECRCALVS